MEIRPILSTLSRHKTAAALIVLEIALTCAILCNALFLVAQRLETLNMPSGMDDAHLIMARATGIGTQVETVFDFHLIAEVYSGDPYVAGSSAAYQAGFRQIFNDTLQLDFTWGGGIAGADRLPFFLSSGIRVVSHELW